MYNIVLSCRDKKEAENISRIILENRLGACVNIMEKIESLFWWKGKIEESSEALMIVKSKERLLDKLINLIKKNHSYKNPEIISIPITKGSEEYLNWVGAETK